MLDTIGYFLAYLITLPVYMARFWYFFTKRTWCVMFHRNQYTKMHDTAAFCPKCRWEISPWEW